MTQILPDHEDQVTDGEESPEFDEEEVDNMIITLKAEFPDTTLLSEPESDDVPAPSEEQDALALAFGSMYLGSTIYGVEDFLRRKKWFEDVRHWNCRLPMKSQKGSP
ncbi:hypothetical protein FRB97_003349 [Tulasnella sp. 331]|nr:hypothetical protein FRB97_003349 [Tulasnella sp. 331]